MFRLIVVLLCASLVHAHVADAKPKPGAPAEVIAESASASADEAQALADAEAAYAAEVQQFEQSLSFRTGTLAIAPAKAVIELNASFRYLEAADARRVLEDLWGNPPDESVLGMILPKQGSLLDDDSWAVVVTYNDEGHVSDSEASEIDYGAMLVEMQEATAEESTQRELEGYGSIALRGWAEPPHYDATTHKLYWAKELLFNGEHDTLNYDVRVLGRHGYLSLNAVAGMAQVDAVREGMRELLPLAKFEPGATYGDYDASTDRLAGYGIAALVGGGLAAKSGLVAKVIAALVAAKKIVIPLIFALLYGVVRLFKRGGQTKAG